jgi:hypothetical protein
VTFVIAAGEKIWMLPSGHFANYALLDVDWSLQHRSPDFPRGPRFLAAGGLVAASKSRVPGTTRSGYR